MLKSNFDLIFRELKELNMKYDFDINPNLKNYKQLKKKN